MALDLNIRAREVFRHIVDLYLETGDPVGSSALAQQKGISLSPASIRSVMADLEKSGLLYAPHVSAGRLPTDLGLRFYVDGMLEVGNLTEAEKQNIEARLSAQGGSMEQILGAATASLSGLTQCAGLVTSPKQSARIKHIEFVSLSQKQIMAVIVFEGGEIENRLIDPPPGISQSSLIEAGNYLGRKLAGREIADAAALIEQELQAHQTELDFLTQKLVQSGLASLAGGEDSEATAQTLILKGQANLLNNVQAIEDLETIRRLFETLESKEAYLKLLQSAQNAGSVQIYIGAENSLFQLTGCSMIVAPYRGEQRRVIGSIGVIGPVRMNYRRIVPMVDFTASLIGQMWHKGAA